MNTAVRCDNSIAAGYAGGYVDGGGGAVCNGGAAAAATANAAATDAAVEGCVAAHAREASPTTASWLKYVPAARCSAALLLMTMKISMLMGLCSACQQVADPRRSTCYAYLKVQVLLPLNYVQTKVNTQTLALKKKIEWIKVKE